MDPDYSNEEIAREELEKQEKSQQKITESDNQNNMIFSPQHYTVGGYEAIDVIEAKLTKDQFIGYCLGNTLKYNMRFNYKGNKELDTGKAIWYLNRLLATLNALKK